MPQLDVLPTVRSAPQASRGLNVEQITELRSLPYAVYLRTPWWFHRRNQALRSAEYRCRRCQTKRQLQVHHLSYERLGAEEDSDLEVLCGGCHTGEHYNEVQSHVALYARLISDVLSEHRLSDVSDVLEEVKVRCAKSNIRVNHEQFHAAAARLMPRVPFRPPVGKEELYKVGPAQAPLTRAEAAGVIARLGAAGLMKHVPELKLKSQREMERGRALAIVAQAITEQVDRCEAVERGNPEREESL